MPPDQIQQGKKKNPDDIDKVPVEPDQLDGRVVFDREHPTRRFDNQVNDKADADDHMDRVHSGHGEIKREENSGGPRQRRLKDEVIAGHEVLFEFLVVLGELDAEEYGTEDDRQHEKNNDRLALAELSGTNGDSHREAAADKNRCVDSTQP